MYKYKLKENISELNFELNALFYAGIVFNSYIQNDYKITLSNPIISKDFLLKNKIINKPTLLFNNKSFQVALYEEFEFGKIDKEIFIKNMLTSNPKLDKGSLLMESLFYMEVKRLEFKQNKFKEDFLLNVNSRLLRIKEAFKNGEY